MQYVLQLLLIHFELVAKLNKKKEPIIIAAKLEMIGIKRDPKKPKNCGSSIFRYRLCRNATVPPITIDQQHQYQELHL